jgi:hypothetical protein
MMFVCMFMHVYVYLKYGVYVCCVACLCIVSCKLKMSCVIRARRRRPLVEFFVSHQKQVCTKHGHAPKNLLSWRGHFLVMMHIHWSPVSSRKTCFQTTGSWAPRCVHVFLRCVTIGFNDVPPCV